MSTSSGSASAPLVELQGAWLANAGAELMLRTVVTRLTERLGDVRFAIDPAFGTFEKRAELGLLQLFPRTAPGAGAIAPVANLARRRGGRRVGEYLDSYGVVTRGEPDALVDISGFAFSDQWGARKARQRADRAEAFRRRRRPVVFLPQAWGPFEDPAVAAQVTRIVDAADRVYTRDGRSHEALLGVVGERTSVVRAPDLTFDSPPSTAPAEPPTLVVVPNGRLIDRGDWTPESYVTFLAELAGKLAPELGPPTVVLHTGEDMDRQLGRQIAQRTGGALESEPDPLRLKGVLAASEVVVGSRFHALLGALASGVPAMAVGWSHKYEQLFADFGIEHLVVGSDDEPTTAADRVRSEALGDDGDRLRTRLAAQSRDYRTELDALWDDLAERIGQRS